MSKSLSNERLRLWLHTPGSSQCSYVLMLYVCQLSVCIPWAACKCQTVLGLVCPAQGLYSLPCFYKKQIYRHFCSVLPQLKPGQIPCRVTKRSCSWTKCSIPPKFYRGGKKCKIWPWFSTTFASLRTVLLSKSVCPCAKRMHLDRLRALQCTYEQRTCKNSSWRTSLLRENLAETDLPS